MVVLAAGKPVATAVACWMLLAARAATSIVFVRDQVQGLHGRPRQPVTVWLGDVAGLSLAIGATAFSWSGILMAEVARLAVGVGVVDATAGVMFFAYLGALGIPSLVAGIAALAGNLEAGFLLFAVVAFPLGLRFLLWPPAGPRD